jgi:hypothetical protein
MAQATQTEPAAAISRKAAAPLTWEHAGRGVDVKSAPPPLDAATGIAVGVVFGIGAWCLFALAVIGTYR